MMSHLAEPCKIIQWPAPTGLPASSSERCEQARDSFNASFWPTPTWICRDGWHLFFAAPPQHGFVVMEGSCFLRAHLLIFAGPRHDGFIVMEDTVASGIGASAVYSNMKILGVEHYRENSNALEERSGLVLNDPRLVNDHRLVNEPLLVNDPRLSMAKRARNVRRHGT